jgi:hypothetical protein
MLPVAKSRSVRRFRRKSEATSSFPGVVPILSVLPALFEAKTTGV